MSSTNSPGANCQIIMPLYTQRSTNINRSLLITPKASNLHVCTHTILVWVIQVLMKVRCPTHRKLYA